MYILFVLRWFRLPASNHSFHHEADLTGTLRKRKQNIIEVENQMIIYFCWPNLIFKSVPFGKLRELQNGSFLKRYIENGGIFLLPKKSSLDIYLRQCTCLLDGKVVGQAAKGEPLCVFFLGGKCDHSQTIKWSKCVFTYMNSPPRKPPAVVGNLGVCFFLIPFLQKNGRWSGLTLQQISTSLGIMMGERLLVKGWEWSEWIC